MATRMKLSDGTFIYPSYYTRDERYALKRRIDSGSVRMYCGCRSDVRLEYRISADMRFIPAHLGYEHLPGCDRYDIYKRTSAYISTEYGDVKAYLSFDYRSFSFGRDSEEEDTDKKLAESPKPADEHEQENGKEQPAAEKKEKRKKDKPPALNLDCFVREVNHDAYLSRIKDGKYAYLSREYYRNAVVGRLKHIRLNGVGKTLAELNINTDKVSFIYAAISGHTDSSLSFTASDKQYSIFVPENVLKKAENRFTMRYGLNIDDCLSDNAEVMAAGFLYKRVSRKGTEYRCIGRLTLFLSNRYGIYSSDISQLKLYDVIMDYCRKTGALFLFPDDGAAPYEGIISYRGVETAVYAGERPPGYQDGCSRAVMLNGEIPDIDTFGRYITRQDLL
jgi:hypothetical protein